MEWCGHWKKHRALRAFGLCDFQCALDGGLVAGHDHLPAAIVVCGLTDLSLCGFLGHRNCRLVIHT